MVMVMVMMMVLVLVLVLVLCDYHWRMRMCMYWFFCFLFRDPQLNFHSDVRTTSFLMGQMLCSQEQHSLHDVLLYAESGTSLSVWFRDFGRAYTPLVSVGFNSDGRYHVLPASTYNQ